MAFVPRNPDGCPPPLPHGVSPRYYGWLMTFYPDEMVNYEIGRSGLDPRHALRGRYQDDIFIWRSQGPTEERAMMNILLDRAEILMQARTEQGPDGVYYWVGAPGNLGMHRISVPFREYEHVGGYLLLTNREGHHEYHSRQHVDHPHHDHRGGFERQGTRELHRERVTTREHVTWREHSTPEMFGPRERSYGEGFSHHHHLHLGHNYGMHSQQGVHPSHHEEFHRGPCGSGGRQRHIAGSRFRGGFLHGREEDLAGPYAGGHHAGILAQDLFGNHSDDESE